MALYVDPREELTKRGLRTCVHEICTVDATEEPWEATRDEFDASFKRFVDACKVANKEEERKWTEGIRATQQDFVKKMNITEKTSADVQEILEAYMLLVNASFLVEAFNAMTYEYMNGIQFPGLWSRVLYKDDTPNKKYRNMLVGCRPMQFTCPATQNGGWTLMLFAARMDINYLLQTHPNSLLSEYDTNLSYALNYFENCTLIPDPPSVNEAPMKSLYEWMVPVDGGENDGMEYKLIGINYILPAFLGVPCGVNVCKGFVFILTTDGEIFKLQISQLVSIDGVERRQLLIYNTTKCIVEYPNKCTIKRINFEKGTAKFPALTSCMPRRFGDRPPHNMNWFCELSPTSLLVDPGGMLLVLSHAQSKMYEIDPLLGEIRGHWGQPTPRGVRPRARTDPPEDEKNCTFKELMCGKFDGRGNLFVCDQHWIRKITYGTTLQGGNTVRDHRKFTVSNIINLHEYATSIGIGPTGVVVAEAIWDRVFKRYFPRLVDVQIYNHLDKHGNSIHGRTTTDIMRVGSGIVCSILVDGADQVVFCANDRLEVVDREKYTYINGPGKIPTRGGLPESEHLIMHKLEFQQPSLSYLTWFGGSILACTTSNQRPVLSFLFGKQQTTNKRPLPDASDAQGRESRPRTAPAGGAAGGTRALLQQMAQMCV